jgi:hypothetical protein
MDSNPPNKAGQLFEYFLYTAIILETGLAALVYKMSFGDTGLGSLKIYFGVLYFAFLAWAISQLNKLHRKRQTLETTPRIELELETEPEPAAAPVPAPSRPKLHARPVLGLTIAQLAIVLLVFGTAVATFSWAFSILRSSR